MTIEFKVSSYSVHIYQDRELVGQIIKLALGGWCVDCSTDIIINYDELKTIHDKVIELIELDSRPSTVETTPQQPAP